MKLKNNETKLKACFREAVESINELKDKEQIPINLRVDDLFGECIVPIDGSGDAIDNLVGGMIRRNVVWHSNCKTSGNNQKSSKI